MPRPKLPRPEGNQFTDHSPSSGLPRVSMSNSTTKSPFLAPRKKSNPNLCDVDPPASDFVEPEHKSSMIGCTANLITAIVGAGRRFQCDVVHGPSITHPHPSPIHRRLNFLLRPLPLPIRNHWNPLRNERNRSCGGRFLDSPLGSVGQDIARAARRDGEVRRRFELRAALRDRLPASRVDYV